MMTNLELVQLIADHDSELLAKIAEVVHEAEAEGPEVLHDVLQGFELVASRISEQEKTAEGGDWKESLKKGVGEGAGKALVGVGAGLAVAGGSDLYRYAKGKLSKHRNWKRMVAHNPQWAQGKWSENEDMTEEHKKKLPKAFDTVHRLAPDVAADPVTSSLYVRHLTTGHEPHEAMKRLVDTQKTISEGREKSRLRTL